MPNILTKVKKSVAIIIAHPDDETLWAGGNILLHPEWNCFIVCLCRGKDTDRAPKFFNALKILKSEGVMGDLDDGPDQKPLDNLSVEQTILDLLPENSFDHLITHNPNGEYTRHLRHEETGKAVIHLWGSGKISTGELWTFAYNDNNKEYYPKPVENSSFYLTLPNNIWAAKYDLITKTYGFKEDSWEAETTPKAEAFWQFSNPVKAALWLQNIAI
jgi:pentatricopeptide repeat protein